MENFPTPEKNIRPEIVVPIVLSSDDLLGSKGMWTEQERITALSKEMPKVWAIVSHLNKTAKGKNLREEFSDLAIDMGLPQRAIKKLLANERLFEAIEDNKITGFNMLNQNMSIDGGSTESSILNSYSAQQEQLRKGEKELEDKSKIEAVKRQSIIDTMFAALPGLNFSDMEGLLTWLNEYNSHVSYMGTDGHKDEILKVFKDNGYTIEDNLMPAQQGSPSENKKEKGRAMIGFMLANLEVFRSEAMKRDIEQWKKQ